MIRSSFLTSGILLLIFSLNALGQRENPEPLIAAQREAMKSLSFLDGVWRGPAWTVLPSGQRLNITQTERVGPFLNGSVKVVEGRGYDETGKVAFNSLGIISYDPAKKVFKLQSHAQGRAGEFILTPTPDGCIWDIHAGPMTIRHTVVIKDGIWHEVGDHMMPGKEPVRFMEMKLKRIGDSTWPADGAVSPK